MSIANEHRIGPGRLWVKLSRQLAAGGFRCVRIDVDGFGDSPPRPGRQDQSEQSVHSVLGIDDILDAAQAVSPEEPGDVVLFGHSSSGYLILEAALELAPRGVCSVNPFLVFQPPEVAAVVVRMGHFSAIAGALALAVLAIPVTLRTTEDMLNLVPIGMKDSSAALGAYPWRTTLSVLYPAARSGIVTGLLLAIARISGETAPLLFTALNNQFWSTNLNAPMANLPVVIFQFALSPYKEWQDLAWAGALIITVTILILSISARVLLALLQAERGAGR